MILIHSLKNSNMRKTLFVLCLTITMSCRTLPKITPFVDASSEMRKGINAGTSAIDKSLETSELSLIVSTDNVEQKLIKQTLSSLDSSRKEIANNARIVDNSMSSISAYAGALNNLTESGSSGEKNALEALKSLNDVLDIVVPSAMPVVNMTKEGIGKIAGEIAKAKALNKLTRIMEEATPVIERYDQILPKVIDNLIALNESICSEKKTILLIPSSLNANVLNYQKVLENNPLYINNYKKLKLIIQYESEENETKKKGFFDNIKKMESSIKEEDISQRHLQIVEEIKLVDTEKARIATMVEKVLSIQKRYNEDSQSINKLLRKSKQAINAWAGIHQEIKEKLGEKTAPDFMKLIDIVDDLKELREKIKSLNP
jgi:hypothetical protein